MIRRTLQLAMITNLLVLHALVGTDTTDIATSRSTLDLHRLRKLNRKTLLPVVKGQPFVYTPASKPCAASIFGAQLIDVDPERILFRADFNLLPLLLQILCLADGFSFLSQGQSTFDIGS